MLKNISGLDHVGIDPEDIWEAFKQFSRLGFTVTTPGRFPGLPVESCQVTFADKFLSISTTFIDGRHPDTEWIARTKPPGITELMLGSKDLQALKAELKSGYESLLAGHAEAEVERRLYLDGNILAQRFHICVLAPGMLEGIGTLGFCQHGSAELVYRPPLLQHANTADGISSLTFVHPQPATLQAAYTDLLGECTVSVTAGRFTLNLSGVLIHFVSEAELARQVPDFTDWAQLRNKDLKVICFSVRDIAATIEYFKFMGIACFNSAGTLYVQAQESCGFLLGFQQN